MKKMLVIFCLILALTPTLTSAIRPYKYCSDDNNTLRYVYQINESGNYSDIIIDEPCNYGCSNFTLHKLGYPDCLESPVLFYIIIIITVIILAVIVNVVL